MARLGRKTLLALGLLGLAAGAHSDVDWPRRVEIEPGDPGSTPSADPGISIAYPCPGRTCDLDRFMERTRACVLYVIRAGKVALHVVRPDIAGCQTAVQRERYGLASVTKSVVSLLFGRVFTDPSLGPTLDLDERAATALARAGLTYPGPATWRDLLKMSSAMDWPASDDTSVIRIEADGNGDPVGPHRTLIEAARSVLESAEFDAPRFRYSGFDSLLLGVMAAHRLTQLPGSAAQSLGKGVERFFWKPLGMRRPAQWKADFDHQTPAYCCAYAAAGDVAALGWWVLQRYRAGLAGDRDPMTRWVHASVKDRTPGVGTCRFGEFHRRIDYGYQWWVLPGTDMSFSALGAGGQFLHIMPAHDVVVAQFGKWNRSWSQAKERRRRCESFLVHEKIAEALSR